MNQDYTRRQIEILNTAIDYVSKNGIMSFSMRHIADAVGIKQATLYDHFVSKKDIIKGIFDIYKNDLLTYTSDLGILKVSKLTKIRMYFLKMSELIQYRPGYMNLILFEIYQYRDVFENGLTVLLQNIKDIINKSDFDDEADKNIDYDWVIIQTYSVLHYFLKQKLLDQDFDVLVNADIYWNKLETLLRNCG